MNIFYTSDTHFYHQNIIEFCARPFKDVEEMNHEIIARWNRRVTKHDLVYHLGDFSFGSVNYVPELLSQLNGEIILVKGNHDRSVARMLKCGFKEVVQSMIISVVGPLDHLIGVALTHKPMTEEEITNANVELNLHGHVHEKWVSRGKNINVGVDVRDFEPKTLNELLG